MKMLLLILLLIIDVTRSINLGIQSLVLGITTTKDINEQLIRLLTFGHMQAVTGIATINKRKGYYYYYYYYYYYSFIIIHLLLFIYYYYYYYYEYIRMVIKNYRIYKKL